MFIHYLKIASRNMWKYKNQSLISIFGLAAGFTCFALATLWVRYEMTYDSFPKNAKQMYVIYKPDMMRPTDYKRSTNKFLADDLKKTFPEIVNATSILPADRRGKVMVDDVDFPALVIRTDSSFLRMFDVNMIEGSWDFIIPGSNKMAITPEKARQLFGNEHPIGKTLSKGRYTICAVVSGMSKQSNYPFDLIEPLPNYSKGENMSWSENTIIELVPGTNIEAFEKKLYDYQDRLINKLKIIPLTKLHYTGPDIERDVKIQHIYIFAISGLLVILCSLFNYINLFVSRFRIRQKEMSLRMVCGASGRSLLAMLSVEFLLTLLFAILFGSLMMQMIHRTFLLLSDIQMNLLAIFRESFLYIIGVILVSLFAFQVIVFIFRHRSLDITLRKSDKKLFRKISVVTQLVISIGFSFCTGVMLKQMYFLYHTNELGFSFKNRGSISMIDADRETLINQLNQIPEIIEVVDATGMTILLPASNAMINVTFSSWDNQPDGVESMSMEGIRYSPEYIAFYELRLVAGELLNDADPETSVLLNESAVKAFGWREPVGKQFADYTVKGVIKNVCNFAPTQEAKPVFYIKPSPSSKARRDANILFKYREGTWKTCKKKIELLIEKELSGYIMTYNSEEEYNKYLKSEKALIKLLSAVSAICLLICMFGFYSLVSLTCEERRKSIAIRKINGATVGDIIAIFTKEYSLLLLVGAAVAFPAGFLIMQRWLEQYVKQTIIPAWIYLSILAVLASVIVLCVGWRVYKSSSENPAEAIKN